MSSLINVCHVSGPVRLVSLQTRQGRFHSMYYRDSINTSYAARYSLATLSMHHDYA